MIRLERRHGLALPLCCGAAFLECSLQAMLTELGLPGADIELVLVSEADQATLNENFLGCFGPTNILSFPENSQEPEPARPFLGTLFLSPETLRREAFLYGQDEEEHCLRLLAHGLGHLLGHDHGPEMDELCQTLEKAGKAASAQSLHQNPQPAQCG